MRRPIVALTGDVFRTHDRAVVDAKWLILNLAKLLAVLAVGFILAAATHPDALPNEPLRKVETLLANGFYSYVFIGMLVMMPMGLVYLGVLALVARRWAPISQRIASVILSPLVTGFALLSFAWNTTELVVFALGVPVVYSIVLTLPAPRHQAPGHDAGAGGEASG